MKQASVAVVSVLAIVLAVVLSFGLASSTEPAYASEHTCTITELGESPNLTITCTAPDGSTVSPSEIDVQSIVNGVVTVVVENEIIKTVIKEVKVPGPTVTVRPDPVRVTETARPAPVRVTETVRVPTERETVFVAGEPRTVFVEGPTQTRTVTAPPLPAETVTETTAPQQARQAPPEDATIDGDTGFFRPDIDFGDDEVTAGEAGIGLLSLLALLALILFAMYGGYVLGYKDKERVDTDFMRALSESIALRKNR